MADHKHFISIWFFIGALLSVYGLLILAAGVYEWINPAAQSEVAMAELHMPVWWGLLLMAIGAVYVVKFRPGKE